MKKLFLISLFSIILLSAFIVISNANGAGGGSVSLKEVSPLGAGFPEGAAGIAQLVGRVIKAVLGLIGAIALLMFVYGGFLMLASGGKPDLVNKGKGVLIWSVIGLVVIITSYTLADFVIKGIMSGVPGGEGGGGGGATGKDDSKCTAWGGTCQKIGCTLNNFKKENVKDCIKEWEAGSTPLTCQQNLCLSSTDWDYVCCKSTSAQAPAPVTLPATPPSNPIPTLPKGTTVPACTNWHKGAKCYDTGLCNQDDDIERGVCYGDFQNAYCV